VCESIDEMLHMANPTNTTNRSQRLEALLRKELPALEKITS